MAGCVHGTRAGLCLRDIRFAGKSGVIDMAQIPTKWDEEADVVIVGYGFAGSAAAIAAHDAGANVLLLEKAPEADKGGNSRVSGQIVFWPNDVESFENNPAMIHTYLTGLPHVYPVGTPYNTGDGVRMGIKAGADLWHMGNIAGPEFFFKAPEIPFSRWINLPHVNSYMFVARDGERFMAEGNAAMGADRHGKINYHGTWMQQPAPVPIHLILRRKVPQGGLHRRVVRMLGRQPRQSLRLERGQPPRSGKRLAQACGHGSRAGELDRRRAGCIAGLGGALQRVRDRRQRHRFRPGA